MLRVFEKEGRRFAVDLDLLNVPPARFSGNTIAPHSASPIPGDESDAGAAALGALAQSEVSARGEEP